jgi:hypothetical protein
MQIFQVALFGVVDGRRRSARSSTVGTFFPPLGMMWGRAASPTTSQDNIIEQNTETKGYKPRALDLLLGPDDLESANIIAKNTAD